MRFRSAVVMAALVCVSGSAAWAEPLSTYVVECKAALNIDTIPGYSCTDGISVPSSDGFQVASSNNYVGKVYTGNPDVDAIFLCRDVDLANNRASLNGYILQNRVNGYTCFFDARNNTIATNLPDVDSAFASVYWEDPAGMDGACQNCHANDPYIVTPGLAFAFRELQMLYGTRPYLGPYNITSTNDSSSHFSGWQSDAQSRWLSTSCASGCHRHATGTLTTIGDRLLQDGLMPPRPDSIYDDVPASSLVMSAIW